MAVPASPLQEAIERLIKKEPGWRNFAPKPAVGGRPGSVSIGTPGAGADGGLAFEEDDFEQREYWPERTLLSSDGFFSFSYRPIRSILLKDGTRATFQEPT